MISSKLSIFRRFLTRAPQDFSETSAIVLCYPRARCGPQRRRFTRCDRRRKRDGESQIPCLCRRTSFDRGWGGLAGTHIAKTKAMADRSSQHRGTVPGNGPLRGPHSDRAAGGASMSPNPVDRQPQFDETSHFCRNT